MSTDFPKRIAALSENRRQLLVKRLRTASADPRLHGGRLIAAVTGSDIDTSLLRRYCEEQLPQYMVPQLIAEVQEIPRTAAGKVDRKLIASREWSVQTDVNSDIVRPRTSTEEKLASIWCDVLGFEDISVHDNFFEVGGDSLLTIRILSRAAKEGMHIAPDAFFGNPTIAGQAAVVSESLSRPVVRRAAEGHVPLLPIQHWFFEHIKTDPHHWNQSVLFELPNSISTSELEAAFSVLVNHYDALRTQFSNESGQWSAEICGQRKLPKVKQIDLERVCEAEQESRVADVSTGLNAGFELGCAPLMAVAHFVNASNGKEKLLIVIHHLIVDMESWRIMQDDLSEYFSGRNDFEKADLSDPTVQLQVWARKLVEVAETPNLDRDHSFWEEQLLTEAPRIPRDFAATDTSNTEADSVRLSYDLESQSTKALLSSASMALSTSPYIMLLSALCRAIAQWSGATRIALETEGHGRESSFMDCDASGTLGWLTTVYPLIVDALDNEAWREPVAALRVVKESVGRLPNNGFTFGLLKELSKRVGSESKLKNYTGADVLFNYLGQTDQGSANCSGLEIIDAQCGPARSDSCERAFLIEVNARVSKGKLLLDIAYNEKIHNALTIEKFAKDFLTAIQDVIDCADTAAGTTTVASDFPLANLSTDEFDQLSEQLDVLDD